MEQGRLSVPCQIEQHKIPMDDRKSQKKKKEKRWCGMGFIQALLKPMRSLLLILGRFESSWKAPLLAKVDFFSLYSLHI